MDAKGSFDEEKVEPKDTEEKMRAENSADETGVDFEEERNPLPDEGEAEIKGGNPNKIGYKDILKEKEFMKVVMGEIISRFGDSIDFIAYGWMVFQLTGSAALLAVLFAVNGIPSLVFNMVSGVVVTYMQKKKVVYTCDFGRGVVVLLTAVLYITGNIAVWHLFVFTFINSTFEAFRAPASAPLFTQLISKEKYDYALSTSSTARTFAELVGYSVAGLLIGTIGIGAVILIDAITFFASGIITMSLKVEREVLSKTKLTLGKYFSDLKGGFLYVYKSKLILSICLFAGGFNLLLIPFNALQPAYVEQILNRGPEAISVIAASFMFAMLIGGIIAPIIKSKISGKKLFVLGGFFIGIGYLMFSQLGAFNESKYILLYVIIPSTIMGIVFPIFTLPIRSAIMSKIDSEYLPRTIAMINALALSTIPLGGALVGALVLFVPLKEVYVIFSLAVLLLFITQIFNKSLREL
ncbi:MAG: MFS transporter [Alkaliphilus sp.]